MNSSNTANSTSGFIGRLVALGVTPNMVSYAGFVCALSAGTALALQIAVAISLLMLGRRLYWLFVAGVGFVVAMELATIYLDGSEEWVRLALAVIAGLVGAPRVVLDLDGDGSCCDLDLSQDFDATDGPVYFTYETAGPTTIPMAIKEDGTCVDPCWLPE